jgi:hypothetical protein
MLRPAISRPVCLVVKHPSGAQHLIFLQSVAALMMWGALSDEDGSVVYIRCWSSPAQSFSGPSPAGIMTIFYCLRFETPPAWRAGSPYLYPSGTGRPSYTPRHWVSFSSPPATRRTTVEEFELAFAPGTNSSLTCPAYNISASTHKTHFLCCSAIVAVEICLYSRLLRRRCLVTCLHATLLSGFKYNRR